MESEGTIFFGYAVVIADAGQLLNAILNTVESVNMFSDITIGSGKGTWESNPYVWVYDFELIK